MTYNFDFKPTKKFVRDVFAGLEQHIDKYTLMDKPDRNTRVYTSEVNGKTAVVSFSRHGISVESDDDLSEYFNKRVNGNYSEIDQSSRLTRAGISLIFYIFNVSAFLIAIIIELLIYRLPGSSFAFLALPLTLITYFVVFFLTFKPIYENTGERTWRTVFIQSGGIFTVLHIAFFILKTIAYAVYQNVKESYVIPNFTVEQIDRGRKLYNNISELMRIQNLGYLFLVLLPLIISAFVSWIRLNKKQQETLPIETSQVERN